MNPRNGIILSQFIQEFWVKVNEKPGISKECDSRNPGH
jgi:hypothetical protein